MIGITIEVSKEHASDSFKAEEGRKRMMSVLGSGRTKARSVHDRSAGYPVGIYYNLFASNKDIIETEKSITLAAKAYTDAGYEPHEALKLSYLGLVGKIKNKYKHSPFMK